MSQDVDINYISPDVIIKTIPSTPVPGPNQTKIVMKVAGTSIKNTSNFLVDYTLLAGKKVTIGIGAGALFAPTTPSADFRAELVIDPGGSETLIAVFRGFSFNESIEETFSAPTVNRTIRLRVHNETSSDARVSARWVGLEEDI